MFTRPFKLLIGKSVSRDAEIVAGEDIATVIASGNIADGEVVVLDKNKNVLGSGKTKSDTDTIYLCQGTSKTFDYTNESGTTTSTNRKVVFSDPIQASGIKSYKGKSYAAIAEQVVTVTYPAVATTVGREYVLRIVYKDLAEHPGQFTQTIRRVCTSATQATHVTSLVADINNFPGIRVTAADSGGAVFTLTGKAIPECTTGVNDIEEYRQVNFEVFVTYIDSDDVHQSLGATIAYTTKASAGSGTWEQIRDLEKVAQGYKGITNKTQFPVIKPDSQVSTSGTYDLITIEHDNSYLSSDNQYVKKTPITTILALIVDASQGTQILAALNSWMESCGFEPVTI
jgi:membrane-bound inhibitor of C-type lysozyme